MMKAKQRRPGPQYLGEGLVDGFPCQLCDQCRKSCVCSIEKLAMPERGDLGRGLDEGDVGGLRTTLQGKAVAREVVQENGKSVQQRHAVADPAAHNFFLLLCVRAVYLALVLRVIDVTP